MHKSIRDMNRQALTVKDTLYINHVSSTLAPPPAQSCLHSVLYLSASTINLWKNSSSPTKWQSFCCRWRSRPCFMGLVNLCVSFCNLPRSVCLSRSATLSSTEGPTPWGRQLCRMRGRDGSSESTSMYIYTYTMHRGGLHRPPPITTVLYVHMHTTQTVAKPSEVAVRRVLPSDPESRDYHMT